jgi:hypothetical protein
MHVKSRFGRIVPNCPDHEDGCGGYVFAGVESAEGDFSGDGEVLIFMASRSKVWLAISRVVPT